MLQLFLEQGLMGHLNQLSKIQSVSTRHQLQLLLVAPFILQIIINLLTIRSWWDFHNSTLGCRSLVFRLN
jgi:hypothetical protein